MIAPTYIYRAKLVRVVDADTYELDLDLGMRVHHQALVRLHGFYAPEKSTPDGKLAALRVTGILGAAHEIVLQTYRDKQTFARWLADIYVDGRSLVDLCRECGIVEGGIGAKEAP